MEKKKHKNKENKPDVFYKVKITQCNAVHTCQLSTQFYQTTINTSAGVPKLDLARMKTLIMALKGISNLKKDNYIVLSKIY